MKILVACELPESALDQLRLLAPEVIHAPHVASEELPTRLKDVGVLVVGMLRVTPDAIQQAGSLQMIVHAGEGPGEIAVEAASNAGVFVTHCPGVQGEAVAELAMGLILALDRRIVDYTVALRDGHWIRGELADARGLAGRTLGILGYGSVGHLLARRALAFDMRVLAWAPHVGTLPPGELEVTVCGWPRELARACEIVVVLGPPDEADVIVDAEFIDSMRPGAYLVHVGGPALVDRAAVRNAIETKGLRVGLDVFATDPGAESTRFRCALCESPNVIATQHVGAITAQALAATADEVTRVVTAFMVTGDVTNCLNLCERSPATWQLVLRIRDQVGVMAAILEAVRADGINAQEISSRVFTGAKAAWCTIALDERPSTEALEMIRGLPDVLHLELRAVV